MNVGSRVCRLMAFKSFLANLCLKIDAIDASSDPFVDLIPLVEHARRVRYLIADRRCTQNPFRTLLNAINPRVVTILGLEDSRLTVPSCNRLEIFLADAISLHLVRRPQFHLFVRRKNNPRASLRTKMVRFGADMIV